MNLNLKKLFVVEIASIVIVVVLAIVLVEVTPYLASSKLNSSIGVFNQKNLLKAL